MAILRAVVAAVCFVACAASQRSFEPASVSFQELALPNKNVMRQIERALTDVGVLVVSNIPGFERQREATLVEASDCVHFMEADVEDHAGLHTQLMPDGTKRLSLVTQTKGDELAAIEGLSGEKCRRFAHDAVEFRETVSSVSKIFVERLDEVLGTGISTNLFRDVSTDSFINSMAEVMRTGIQLEHFHSYSRGEDTSLNTLDLHTDHGLFIAVAPALSSSGQPDRGFFLQLKSGELVKPEIKDGNSLMFILGDGMSNWITPVTGVALRPAPHMVKVPAHEVRSWYGRMFLPPSSAFLEKEGKTFGAVRTELRRALDEDVSYSVCTDGYELFTRDLADGCGANEILCWGECRSSPSCNAGDAPACIDPRVTSEIVFCDPAQHNGVCAPQCVANSVLLFNSGNDTRGNSFCNGFNVAMYMAGFTAPGDATDACLVFLFSNLVLDSPLKYAIACIGTIGLGILVEFVVKLRRQYKAKFVDKQDLKWYKAGALGLYAVQVTLGYFAMLVAMTYAYVFFIMIVMGLVIGYGLFNMHVPANEYSDPCCNYDVNNVENSSGGSVATVTPTINNQDGTLTIDSDKQQLVL